jgi:hypothetical protein
MSYNAQRSLLPTAHLNPRYPERVPSKTNRRTFSFHFQTLSHLVNSIMLGDAKFNQVNVALPQVPTCVVMGLPFSALFMCTASILFFCVSSAIATAAAAAGISVQVDPLTGDDSRCNTTLICRTIAHAVQLVGVSQVNLSAGVFNESTVSIDNVSSLVVSGVPSSTFFDCSRRLGPTTGAALQHQQLNRDDHGRHVPALLQLQRQRWRRVRRRQQRCGVAVQLRELQRSQRRRCVGDWSRPRHCSCALQNSNFSGNAAIGGLIGCPAGSQSSEPCSTWGGAVAAFEILNVSVTGCSMTDNSAVADVPWRPRRVFQSRNAVAGGGCVSVLFRGNCSASTLRMSGNSFLRCAVDVSRSRNIRVGNGTASFLKSTVFVLVIFDCSSVTVVCRIRRRVVRLLRPVGGFGS